MNYHALCFVDMPFGQKPDLKSGVVVDFDQIYNDAIKPAIEHCDLGALRGDEELTGGLSPARCSRDCCYRTSAADACNDQPRASPPGLQMLQRFAPRGACRLSYSIEQFGLGTRLAD